MLRKHLEQICKGQGEKNASRTALAETFMNKSVAGKKGSRNQFHYHPSNANDYIANTMQSEESSNNATYVYDEIYHNDHPFVLCMLPSDAKTCKGCKDDFCHRQKIIPFDLVFSQRERYYFLLHGDWKNKQASNKESTHYYHRFVTHSKNRTKFIWRIYSRYQSSGKFLCSFVSLDLEN